MVTLQSKMDEEREIYEQERDSTDERFRTLELKIKGNNRADDSVDVRCVG